MKEINPIALFRLSVLGPLVSREKLGRGELQQIIRELAQRQYAIPNSRRHYLGEKTIQAWFYQWRKHGIDGLVPKTRADRGQSRIAEPIQQAILGAKRANPRRSIGQISQLLVASGQVAADSLSRSAIHWLLQQHGLSRMKGSSSQPEEKRSFNAEYTGAIWYGDVMHGPRVIVDGRTRKVYLVTLFDDASRLVAHSAFCLGETALDIEGVLKQAILKRGLPHKLIVDNGAAYRARTLQGICARLQIHLIYCRPYAPEGKGKLERWHRTFRDQFLSEYDASRVTSLEDLNARLWAWCESAYHRTPHSGLSGMTPLARYQQDLPKIRTLGQRAATLDTLFYHRMERHVRKDGTLSYLGERFEVPYELAGKTVNLVVDPHAGSVVGVEDDDGQSLGMATKLDAIANVNRVRCKNKSGVATSGVATSGVATPGAANLVELAYEQYHGKKGA